MRVDAGLARLLGLSRTAAAALAEDGGVDLDGARGRQVRPADAGRVAGGAAARSACAAGESAGRDRGHDDPVRRRRHRRGRQAGGRRRARIGRLDRADGARRAGRRGLPDHHVGRARTAGHRAPTRRRHVGRDGGGAVRARLHRAQAGVQAAHRRQALSRTGARTSGSVQRHHRCADRPTPRPRLEVRRHRGRQAQHHALRHGRGVHRRPACSTCTWKPVAHTRFGCTSRRCTIRAAAT